MNESTSTAASYSANAVTLVLGLTVNEWCLLIGAVGAVATAWSNWHFKQKHLDLARERMERELNLETDNN